MNRRLQLLAGALAVLAVALYSGAGVLGARIPGEEYAEGMIWGTSTLVLALIGAVIAVRRPRHRLGWLLFGAGFGEILAGVSNLYGQYVDHAGNQLPYAAQIGWVGGTMWAFSAGALLIFLPLYFPTGRAPSPRWRWVGWVGVAAVAGLMLGTLDVLVFMPELMGQEWEVLETALAGRPLFVISDAAFPLMMAAAPLALLSLVVRFLRSTGEERQQIKLLIFAVAMTVAFVLVTGLTEILPRAAEAVATALAMPSIGVATMIAVLRYRLFEIDRVVSRTLTYGLLTVLLAGIYLGGVTVLTAATAPFTRESPVAVAAATLLAAAAFRPARRRIQSVVDRRFNRTRYNARRTVEGFAASLRQEVDLDDVRAQLLETVDDVLQPTAMTVWLRFGITP